MTLVTFNRNKDYVPETFKSLVDDLLNDSDINTNGSKRFVPRTNILEKENVYEIQLSLPGWSKKEVEAKIEDNVLSVKGAKEGEKEANTIYHFREFSYGSFEKRFELPEDAKDDIKAEFRDGILYISIPKDERKLIKKQIEIK